MELFLHLYVMMKINYRVIDRMPRKCF